MIADEEELFSSIVDRIDAGEITPLTRHVARTLLSDCFLEFPEDAAVVNLFDTDPLCSLESFETSLWKRVDEKGPNDDGLERILIVLCKPMGAVDWYLAEFLIHWALQAGVSLNTIREAFGVE